MCFFRKRRAKKKALQEEQLRMQQESMKNNSIAEERPTPMPTVSPVEPAPMVVPTLDVEVEKQPQKPAPQKEVKKEAPKGAKKAAPTEAKKTTKAEPKKTTKAEPKEVGSKYHVSQNKDAKSDYYKQWRVRKEGSSKTIKYFETQAEAIDYAEDLADKNDTSVIIHKLDGSIRKQDYDKKS